MASDLKSPAPVLRKVDVLEDKRTAIEQQIVVWEKDGESTKALSNVTDAQVRRMLATMADEIQHYDRAQPKDFLTTILDKIEVDPIHSTLQLSSRIPVKVGNSVASPRGSVAIPYIVAMTIAKVA